MGDMWDTLYRFLLVVRVLVIIFVPLGMWKAGEIIIWLFKNVSISIGG